MTRARELSRLVTPTNFTVDAANARVGVGSTTPASKLDVEGTLTADVVSVGGSVTAATFFGDGEGLTNVGFDTSQISANSISVTGVVTATTFSGNATSATNAQGLTGTPSINVASVNATGVSTFAGNVSIGGTLTYNDVTNIDAVGIITARSGVNVSGNGLVVVGVSTFNDDIKGDNATNISGISSVTATSYFGSGQNLTNLNIPAGFSELDAALFN